MDHDAEAVTRRLADRAASGHKRGAAAGEWSAPTQPGPANLDAGIASAVPADRTELDYVAAAVGRRLFGGGDPWRVRGRYEVLRRIGRGAQGDVFAARDEALDREVALKLLRSDGNEPVAQRRARLAREARALAALAHPNVVTVFDVLVDELDRVCLVMELVDGGDVWDWSDRDAKTDEEIVEVFLQAGRGLAAAHAQGIVHRDVKPANILVGSDEGAKVVDFGLARHRAENLERVTPWAGPASESADALTLTGGIAGTPAYMAPEQHAGADVTERSDQYAFFAALHRVLTREFPFPASSLGELIEAKETGAVVFPLGWRGSNSLRAVIRRGLAADPAERYADMHHAIAALERARGRRRWRSVVAGAVVLGVAALAEAQPGAAKTCPLPDELLDAANSEGVRSALAGVDKPYAPSVAAAAVQRLDAYANAWQEGRSDACAGHGGLRCFRRAATRFRTLTAALFEADAKSVDNTLSAIDGLPDLALCRRESGKVAPTEVSQEDEAFDAKLAAVEALMRLGHNAEARSQAAALVAESERTKIHAKELRGRLWIAKGRLDANEDDALRSFETAFFLGAAADDHHVEWEAAMNRVLRSARGGRFEDGADWLRHAEVAARGLPVDAAETAMAGNFHARGVLLSARGDVEGAIAAYDAGIDRCQQCLFRGVLGMNRAIALVRAGAYEEALRELEARAEAVRAKAGPNAPVLGEILGNMAEIQSRAGRLDEALTLATAAADIFAVAPPRNPVFDGQVLMVKADVLAALDRPQEALEAAAAAVDRLETQPSAPPRAYISALGTLSNAQRRAGEFDTAVVTARRAVDTAAELIPDSAGHREAYAVLGRSLLDAGHVESAAQPFTESMRPLSGSVPLPPHTLSRAHLGRARARLAAGEPEAALDDFDTAAAFALRAEEPDPDIVAHARAGAALCLLHRDRIAEARRRLEVAWAEIPSDLTTMRRYDLAFLLAVASWSADRAGAEALLALAEAGYRDRAAVARLRAVRRFQKRVELPLSLAI